jgi:hypothetical protein
MERQPILLHVGLYENAVGPYENARIHRVLPSFRRISHLHGCSLPGWAMRMIFVPEGYSRSFIGGGWLSVPETACLSGRATAPPSYTLNYLSFRTMKGGR